MPWSIFTVFWAEDGNNWTIISTLLYNGRVGNKIIISTHLISGMSYCYKLDS